MRREKALGGNDSGFLPFLWNAHPFKAPAGANDHWLAATKQNPQTFLFDRRMKPSNDGHSGLHQVLRQIVGLQN